LLWIIIFFHSLSSKGFQIAAAEWWLFALTDYQVISRTSGFGRSAAMRSMRENSIFTINSPRNNGVGVANCVKDAYTRLDDMATDWSGL
jgi:hypothetical protein